MLAIYCASRCRPDRTFWIEPGSEILGQHSSPKWRLSQLPKGAGEVVIVQLPNLDSEATWITKKVTKLLASGVHPSEIIILVQRAVAGTPILDALKSAGVPAKSYYEESQLESAAAQERFALFKLLLNHEDRVALRYLLGAGADDFRCSPYARLHKHCEETGDSPWTAIEKLAQGALSISYTKPLIEQFAKLKIQLDAMNVVKADLAAFVDPLFPGADANLSDLRELALAQLTALATPEENCSHL